MSRHRWSRGHWSKWNSRLGRCHVGRHVEFLTHAEKGALQPAKGLSYFATPAGIILYFQYHQIITITTTTTEATAIK